MRIEAPGPLRAKQRPRVAMGHAYTPEPTRRAERALAWHAVQQVGQRSLQCALKVQIDVQVPPPRAWPAKARDAAIQGAAKPVCRPDLDNLAKMVLDALQGVLWADDSQVSDLVVTRRFGPKHHTTIIVEQA